MTRRASRRISGSLVITAALACAPTPATQPPNAPTPAPATTEDAPAEPAKPAAAASVPVTVHDAATDALLNAIARPHDIARKVVIGRYGGARFAPEGDVIVDGGNAPAFDTLPVIDVHGDRIQVVARAVSSDTGLLVWVDVSSVLPQLVRPAVLHDHASMSGKPGDGTFELAPGEMVEVIEKKGAAARVRTRDDKPFTGWIDATALDPTWEEKPFAYPTFDALLEPGTTIAVRPGGPALHKLAPIDNGKHDAHVISKRGGWLEVEVVERCRPTIRIRGFVRSKTTEITGPQAGGFGCGSATGTVPANWGELADAKPERIAANTELYSADGKLVGRMRSEGDLRRGADGVLRVVTRWGLVPVHPKS